MRSCSTKIKGLILWRCKCKQSSKLLSVKLLKLDYLVFLKLLNHSHAPMHTDLQRQDRKWRLYFTPVRLGRYVMWWIFLGAYALSASFQQEICFVHLWVCPHLCLGSCRARRSSLPPPARACDFDGGLVSSVGSVEQTCQHLFRYRLGNSLVAAVAILTGPSASHPFALPACEAFSHFCLLSVEVEDVS